MGTIRYGGRVPRRSAVLTSRDRDELRNVGTNGVRGVVSFWEGCTVHQAMEDTNQIERFPSLANGSGLTRWCYSWSPADRESIEKSNDREGRWTGEGTRRRFNSASHKPLGKEALNLTSMTRVKVQHAYSSGVYTACYR